MNNLAELLLQWAAEPQKVLYRQYQEGAWQDYTVATLLDLAARWQEAYRGAGLRSGDRVAICMKNGVQWVLADLAALASGLVVVPLYVDDNPDNLGWCLQDAGAALVVADHLRFLPRLQTLGITLPTIVLVRGEPVTSVVTLADWLPETAPPLSVADQPAEALATIVYTSGTVGRPKGVMLSHRNILSNITSILGAYDVYVSDRLLSVLPLTHMFERTAGYYLALQAGAEVTYCRGINELAQDLATQQPTVIMAVPRLFERILRRLDDKLRAAPLRRWLFKLAVGAGWRRFSAQARFYDALLLKTVHPMIARPLLAGLGGRLRHAVVGGAALDQRVARTFIGLGVPLLQGYGLTEASPVVAVNRQDHHDPASVGEPLPGLETRVNSAGELLVRGASVMLGYWNSPEATQACIDAEGWLNTGDLVDIKARRIYIRGRSKHILVLSNGEKIAPEDIESAILRDPLFEQVLVVGEGRPFLVLLVVSSSGDAADLLRRANLCVRHLPRYARIRRVVLADAAWEVENGLMTPTLKIKRNAVIARYQPQIEAVYR
ncbi:MAG TPA: AMP-binding protein [Methylophilaceae bacterium]|nr:AMP-binding protein [Methylophilaceae bacterium]